MLPDSIPAHLPDRARRRQSGTCAFLIEDYDGIGIRIYFFISRQRYVSQTGKMVSWAVDYGCRLKQQIAYFVCLLGVEVISFLVMNKALNIVGQEQTEKFKVIQSSML